jgi:cytochrome P450
VLNDNLYGSAVNPLEHGVRELTVSLIEGFASKGRCDFVREFAEQLPLRVFMQLVDLPLTHLPRLKQLADTFTRPDGSITPEEASAQFAAYIRPILAERKAGQGTDMLSATSAAPRLAARSARTRLFACPFRCWSAGWIRW